MCSTLKLLDKMMKNTVQVATYQDTLLAKTEKKVD